MEARWFPLCVDMPLSSVIYLCINLPWSEERRCTIAAQARRLGIEVQFVEAIAGRDLPPQVPGYDRAERRKCYNHDLTPNEIACVLSHRKALCTFMESEAEYAVIMEDDALLKPNIKEGVNELIHQLHGWEAAKLYGDDEGVLYSLGDEASSCAAVRAVFPRKILWSSLGWLYTRSAAQKLLEGMRTFTLAADAQIGHILLEQGIPCIGVSPYLISTSDPHNESSTIDTSEQQRADQKRRRSLLQYLRYRLAVFRISRAKMSMVRLMRQRLKRSSAVVA